VLGDLCGGGGARGRGGADGGSVGSSCGEGCRAYPGAAGLPQRLGPRVPTRPPPCPLSPLPRRTLGPLTLPGLGLGRDSAASSASASRFASAFLAAASCEGASGGRRGVRQSRWGWRAGGRGRQCGSVPPLPARIRRAPAQQASAGGRPRRRPLTARRAASSSFLDCALDLAPSPAARCGSVGGRGGMGWAWWAAGPGARARRWALHCCTHARAAAAAAPPPSPTPAHHPVGVLFGLLLRLFRRVLGRLFALARGERLLVHVLGHRCRGCCGGGCRARGGRAAGVGEGASPAGGRSRRRRCQGTVEQRRGAAPRARSLARPPRALHALHRPRRALPFTYLRSRRRCRQGVARRAGHAQWPGQHRWRGLAAMARTRREGTEFCFRSHRR
jgi:hypothetical protein